MKNKILTTVLVVAVIAASALVINQTVQAGYGPTGRAWEETGVGQRGAFGDQDMDAIAEALGISTEELQAAHEAAFAKAIDQAVDAELITVAQAEALKSKEGVGRMRLGGLLGAGDSVKLDIQALLIAELGITQAEYDAAHESVQKVKLNEAVAAGKLTQEEVDAMGGMRALRTSENSVTRMRTARRSGIEAALADDTLTQAQTDALLNRLETKNEGGLLGRMGGGRGGMGSQGRGSGLGGGQCLP